MAFGGDVDTFSLTFDKLQYIFSGYGQVRDMFIEATEAQKQGTVSLPIFYETVQDAVMRFSALEFLSIKAVFEIKKAMDRETGMPPQGRPNTDYAVRGQHSSVSVASFIGTESAPMARKEHSSLRSEPGHCHNCGNLLKKNMNFCTSCGANLRGKRG